jgi:glycerol uptake facilitator protein
MTEKWIGKYIGEAIGAFLLVLFGCGLIFVGTLYNGVGDLFSAGMGWGFAVALAVYVTATLSGTHINPAVTLAMAATGRFPWRKVPQYIAAQITGAFLGAVALMLMFYDAFAAFATKQGLTFGGPASEKLGMMLVPYSPHPWIVGVGANAYAQVPIWRGFFTEALATAFLVILILVLLERRSINAPAPWFFPIALGVGVTMLVFITAPLTMTSLNPARDLGPRILLFFMGFGQIAFPGTRSGGSMLVTVGGPLLGGVVGAYFFDLVMKRFYPKPIAVEQEKTKVLVPKSA